jgi:hypothetical protein
MLNETQRLFHSQPSSPGCTSLQAPFNLVGLKFGGKRRLPILQKSSGVLTPVSPCRFATVHVFMFMDPLLVDIEASASHSFMIASEACWCDRRGASRCCWGRQARASRPCSKRSATSWTGARCASTETSPTMGTGTLRCCTVTARRRLLPVYSTVSPKHCSVHSSLRAARAGSWVVHAIMCVHLTWQNDSGSLLLHLTG